MMDGGNGASGANLESNVMGFSLTMSQRPQRHRQRKNAKVLKVLISRMKINISFDVFCKRSRCGWILEVARRCDGETKLYGPNDCHVAINSDSACEIIFARQCDANCALLTMVCHVYLPLGATNNTL